MGVENDRRKTSLPPPPSPPYKRGELNPNNCGLPTNFYWTTLDIIVTMKEKFAKLLFVVSLLTIGLSFAMLHRRQEPFYTHFYLFVWWSYIFLADSWLYLKGGESLFVEKIVEFVTFLVPFSAIIWFIFEAFNLRIQNWAYIHVPKEIWIHWPLNFLAFGTVLPGIFLTGNLLDYYGIFRKNEFSQFFTDELSKPSFALNIAGGIFMLLLPLAFPKYFFPLIWGGFVFLLDPINAFWHGKSLIQEWRQRNWNRTFQLLLAGFICGGLWEFWNFWAGAKWIYTVPLPDFLLRNLKIFEMPVLGFLGFPPFALECFVMTEFAKNLRKRVSKPAWNFIALCLLLFALSMCWLMDIRTVKSFR